MSLFLDLQKCNTEEDVKDFYIFNVYTASFLCEYGY